MVLPIKKRIYLHCTASDFGDDDIVNSWHKNRGFKNLFKEGNFSISTGYHNIILNGNTHPSQPFIKALDGSIEVGRRLTQRGAHVAYDNKYSIGVALIGGSKIKTGNPNNCPFSFSQIVSSLQLISEYMNIFKIKLDSILGHYEYYTFRGLPIKKTCPNINMNTYRQMLSLITINGLESKHVMDADWSLEI